MSSAVNLPLRNLTFRFETSWFKQPDFIDKVKTIWLKPCHANSAVDKVQSKLKRFKQYFKTWGFNVQGERRKLRNNMQDELLNIEQAEENAMLSLSMYNRKVEIHSNILNMLEEDEIYWFKRSHEKWLHEGDNNTEYFHRIANGRKRKNTIISFKYEGESVEGITNLLSHATEYYKKLFGPDIGNQFQLDSDLWDEGEMVSEDDNAYLTRPFTEEEIKAALFQMKKKQVYRP